MGSRSAFIVPLRAGNQAHWDPKEGREASRGENYYQETREGTMDPANLLTKWYWIVELAMRKLGTVLFSLNQAYHLLDWWQRPHVLAAASA
jgi:predicted MarR family transcription regulator